MQDPKISVIIPVYNGANYLSEAINSVLNQTYKNYEIIVVNDGSTDGGETAQIAESFGNKIRYYEKANGGVASTLNFGIDKMESDYFAWLSHDDVYLSNKLEVNAEFIKKYPNDVLFSDFEYFTDSGRIIRPKPFYKSDNELFIWDLVIQKPINGCTIIVPKSAFEKAGTFDNKYPTVQDVDMWYRLAQSAEFRKIDNVLVRNRLHPNQGSKIIITHKQEADSYTLEKIKEVIENHKDLLSSKVILKDLLYLKKLKQFQAEKYLFIHFNDNYSVGLKNLLSYILYRCWNDKFTLYYIVKLVRRIFGFNK